MNMNPEGGMGGIDPANLEFGGGEIKAPNAQGIEVPLDLSPLIPEGTEIPQFTQELQQETVPAEETIAPPAVAETQIGDQIAEAITQEPVEVPFEENDLRPMEYLKLHGMEKVDDRKRMVQFEREARVRGTVGRVLEGLGLDKLALDNKIQASMAKGLSLGAKIGLSGGTLKEQIKAAQDTNEATTDALMRERDEKYGKVNTNYQRPAGSPA